MFLARGEAIPDGLLFFFQAEDGIRDLYVTGVQTCALPISTFTVRMLMPALSRRLREWTVVAAALLIAGFAYTDRKSTRLNSSHVESSYAVFCLKKKTGLRQHMRQYDSCCMVSSPEVLVPVF